MSDTKTDVINKAEAKLQKAQAGQRAMAEYVAESEIRRRKTEKLRILRLEKEAEDAIAEKSKPAAKKAPVRKKA